MEHFLSQALYVTSLVGEDWPPILLKAQVPLVSRELTNIPETYDGIIHKKISALVQLREEKDRVGYRWPAKFVDSDC